MSDSHPNNILMWMFALIVDHVYDHDKRDSCGSIRAPTLILPPPSLFHSHSLSLHLLDELRTGEGKEAEIKAEN